jgi:tRNA-splicing ligase RtcB (3'-phosphate/5'-hydroxy nucleic acid ligase)
MFNIQGKYGNAMITIDQVEDTALKQIYNFVNHPAFTGKISIMPDVHAGSGSVVGFTMTLTDKVVPNTIGVDIGCGMLSYNIGRVLPLKLDRIDILIKRNIPMGTKTYDSPIIDFKKEYDWVKANDIANKFVAKYNEKFGTNFKASNIDYNYFLNLTKVLDTGDIAVNSIGTLGGGNHFIEIGKSDTGDYWITIHSGSRNLGKRVCEYHQAIAKKNLDTKRNEELKSKIDFILSNTEDKTRIPRLIIEAKKDLGLFLTDVNINGLEYLEGQDAVNYFMDMVFTQLYAELNRKAMMDFILDILGIKNIVDRVHSVHNYIDFHDMIIRKGSISSYTGEKMIIPFNMRDGIILCEGKSNEDWNFSAPHGAGRVMSRGEANRKVDLDKFKETMKGIYSSSISKDTLDESPFAYKKAEMIESAIGDTAIVIGRIKPVLNIKSSENENFKEMRKKEREKKRQIGEDADDLIANKDFRKDRKKLRSLRGKF